ncbi:pancreatic progenitor cell differentiation and proliferation factor-like, partial [Mus musculus]|uniref:pancreatic progenitor cell differentiation and proliferation factor-like n=1 Tax=Mus musculus TaxID=10090 RepID=UPI0011AE2747
NTAAISSSGSLVATHDYYPGCLDSSSSNNSGRSAAYPGDTVLHSPQVFPRLTLATGRPASFLGNPPSHSWPQCWSRLSTRQNLPRPPEAQSPVAWLLKPCRSSQSSILARPIPGPSPDLSAKAACPSLSGARPEPTFSILPVN